MVAAVLTMKRQGWLLVAFGCVVAVAVVLVLAQVNSYRYALAHRDESERLAFLREQLSRCCAAGERTAAELCLCIRGRADQFGADCLHGQVRTTYRHKNSNGKTDLRPTAPILLQCSARHPHQQGALGESRAGDSDP